MQGVRESSIMIFQKYPRVSSAIREIEWGRGDEMCLCTCAERVKRRAGADAAEACKVAISVVGFRLAEDRECPSNRGEGGENTAMAIG